MSEIPADTVVKLTYRVERDMWPDDTRAYWAPWSKTEYATKPQALEARGRIVANHGVAPGHLRVVRVTVEVVS